MSIFIKNLSFFSQYRSELFFGGSLSKAVKNPSSFRHFTIKAINDYAIKIIGKSFLSLSDSEKKAELDQLVCKEYEKIGITGSTIEEAERNLQLYMITHPSLIGTKPGLVSANNSLNKYWSAHEILPPFKQGSIDCKFADKDVALDKLSRLIEEEKIKTKDTIFLLVQGCDNNEAATKLRIYLEDKLGKKTYMNLSE
jgi:hypothetical protein